MLVASLLSLTLMGPHLFERRVLRTLYVVDGNVGGRWIYFLDCSVEEQL